MVSVVAGAVVVLFAIGLLGAGGVALWADRTQRDAAGFVTTDPHRYTTPAFALTVEGVDLRAHGPHFLYPYRFLGKIRIEATPVTAGRAVFVGIARTADAERYLAGVERARIRDFGGLSIPVSSPGGPPPGPPADQAFWVASASGTGTQTVVWPVRSGSWAVVVMNADGTAGVDVRATVGATVHALLWIAIGLLIAGVLVLGAGALLIWLGTRTPKGTVGPVPPPPPPAQPS